MRPETAQGIFVNFKNVQTTARKKIPFGIAQIGKSFRNEITPGNFLFRTREFEQMEMEFFVKPGDDDQWFEYWTATRRDWYIALGIRPDKLRLRPHAADELAHYAKGCADVEYEFPIGWSELEGIANRTDFDLKRHSEFSGKDLRYFDEETREHYMPYVIEPAAGADRATLAFLVDAYDEDVADGEARTVLRLHPQLAPIKAAVFPLLRKDGHAGEGARGLRPAAPALLGRLRPGRRHRPPLPAAGRDRHAVRHHHRSSDAQDGTVTLRDRDSMQQERLPIDRLIGELAQRLARPWSR